LVITKSSRRSSQLASIEESFGEIDKGLLFLVFVDDFKFRIDDIALRFACAPGIRSRTCRVRSSFG
jgi:hypothetical protein